MKDIAHERRMRRKAIQMQNESRNRLSMKQALREVKRKWQQQQ